MGKPAYPVGVSETLVVNEVYLSLQGESTFAGLPCIFVRLTACNLRCSYCDTAYAFTEGSKRPLPDIRAEIDRLAESYSGAAPSGVLPIVPVDAPASGHRLPLVEFTGGEPLVRRGLVDIVRRTRA